MLRMVLLIAVMLVAVAATAPAVASRDDDLQAPRAAYKAVGNIEERV